MKLLTPLHHDQPLLYAIKTPLDRAISSTTWNKSRRVFNKIRTHFFLACSALLVVTNPSFSLLRQTTPQKLKKVNSSSMTSRVMTRALFGFVWFNLFFSSQVAISTTIYTKNLEEYMSPKSFLRSPIKFFSSSHAKNRSEGVTKREPLIGSNTPFWMEKINHQGLSPFNPQGQDYKVFRNVKDYGAVGDGVHDDTAAINLAITSQNRCGGGGVDRCSSSTVSPATVYFPQGRYLISSPIIPYYYTQLIGDAKVPPTLLAASSFDGFAVIDANPYIPGGGGAQYFKSTNNFHRSIRNFIIDVRRVPSSKQQGTGIHWQVAQATSLINIVFEMSSAPDTAHQGIWMEDGSGGFMGDLVFNGGKFGIWGGNQQFTVRNITVNNAQTGVYSLWNWGWTYQDVKFNNCQVGFDIATGGLVEEAQTTGAQAIIDAVVTDTQCFIRTSQPAKGSLAGSLIINNAKLTNVPVAVCTLSGSIVLPGTSATENSKTIATWVQGNVYKGFNGQGTFTQGVVSSPIKHDSLLDSEGRIVSRGHPQYVDHDVSDFVSARDHGAKGDGVTDDTKALQALFDKFSSSKIIFLDAGFYIVTSTLTIPSGTRLVGEAWSVLAGKGPAFSSQDWPEVVIRVGEKGEDSPKGVTEITDVVFTTVGPAPGAIVVEWNVREPEGVQAGAGMWDAHIRLAGSSGTQLDGTNCPTSGAGASDNCYAAFLSLHITPKSTGYFEGTWVWLADHDLDLKAQGMITVYAGRGILSESEGPVWMIGTASEHHVIYQYNLHGAKNHYMGLIQTESPYFQPNPVSPLPFKINSAYRDPSPYDDNSSSWALVITKSENVFIFGAGLYSFFVDYSQRCLETRNCQAQILNIDSSNNNVGIYSLSTVASTYQLSNDNKGVINQQDNINGFASTVTVWTEK